MDIHIRPTVSIDWSTIQKLNNEVFEENAKYDRYLNRQWPKSKEGVAYYKKVTRDTKFCSLIAEVDGTAVGYLVGTERKIDYRTIRTVEIHDMGVSPAYRSKGIGKKLIDAFKDWARKNGYQSIYVNSYFGNDRAVNFYKKQGFAPIDICLEASV